MLDDVDLLALMVPVVEALAVDAAAFDGAFAASVLAAPPICSL